ncbi:MAG: lipoyl synthase [Spirochaetes bacterium]|nr:lipoyl synthase [Spirochaetota bacterium]
MNSSPHRKPDWLKVTLRSGTELTTVQAVLSRYSLHTVCKEANCPNRMECFSRKTATFLILGPLCTRTCTFCNVTPGSPAPPDPEEPERVLRAVRELSLRYVVITSVTRDDLPDGGASYFARTVRLIKDQLPGTQVEVLIPDFQGDPDALQDVLDSGPDVLNHNVETVPRLYPEVRPQADYTRSLELLRRAKECAVGLTSPQGNSTNCTAGSLSHSSSPITTPTVDLPMSREPFSEGTLRTKSGIMVGLGETEPEVVSVLRDLRSVGCDYLTIGQYLSPSRNHHPVVEYVSPKQFARYREIALELGFSGVASAPFVRSSYHAAELSGNRNPLH